MSLYVESKIIPSAFLIGIVYVVDAKLPPVLPYNAIWLPNGFCPSVLAVIFPTKFEVVLVGS